MQCSRFEEYPTFNQAQFMPTWWNFLSNISQWPCNGAKTVELYLKLNFLRDEYLFGLVTVTSTDLLGKSTEN